MGVFNTVRGPCVCPTCYAPGELEVQFKYGGVRQFNYRVGDELEWGPNDVGSSAASHAIVAGIGGPCASCGADNLDVGIVICDQHIVGLFPLGPTFPKAVPAAFVEF